MGSINKKIRKQRVRDIVALRLAKLEVHEINPIPEISEIGFISFLQHFEKNVIAFYTNRKGRKSEWQKQILDNGLFFAGVSENICREKTQNLKLANNTEITDFYKHSNGLRLPSEKWISPLENLDYFSARSPKDFKSQNLIFEEYSDGELPSVSDEDYFDYRKRYDWQPRFEYLPGCLQISEPAHGLSSISYKEYGYTFINLNVENRGINEIWEHSSWEDVRFLSLTEYLQSCYSTWVEELLNKYGI